MEIDNDQLFNAVDPDKERMDFWRNVYNEYNNGLENAKLWTRKNLYLGIKFLYIWKKKKNQLDVLVIVVRRHDKNCKNK